MLNTIRFAFDGFLMFTIFGIGILVILYFFRNSFTIDDGEEINKKADENCKYIPFFKIDVIGNQISTLVFLGFVVFFVVLYFVVIAVGNVWMWLKDIF